MHDIVVKTRVDTCKPGFVFVIDNSDMNIRQSDQELITPHLFAMHLLLNQVNSMLLEDSPLYCLIRHADDSGRVQGLCSKR